MTKDFGKIAEISLLYDFYGALLTDKQREVMALYHEENLSLSEIASEFGISRQAVHDTLKKAEQALKEYEEKLKLMEKFARTEAAIAEIDHEIEEIEKRVALWRAGCSAGAAGESEACFAGSSAGAAEKSPLAGNADKEDMLIIEQLRKIKSVIDSLEE